MSEKQGLLEIPIRLVKKDEELIDRVMVARGLVEEDRECIQKILQMNMWTIKQFKDLTGFKEGSIANKTRPIYRDESIITELDFCYPFADLEGTGPKFIVRNKKSEAILPQAVANDAV